MNEMRTSGHDLRKRELTNILSSIPWHIWERIVREEPEWNNMERFLGKLGFGPFSVLMIVTGLNDFQTKGTADKGYWPPIRELLVSFPNPSTPMEMHDQLLPFYQNERFHGTKVNRLRRFLQSSLAERLWRGSSARTSADFVDIWLELGKTMRQKLEKKTICFAMKCLGLALLMNEQHDFDFSAIPIPADSRVGAFTRKSKICDSQSEQSIQEVWSEILALIRQQDPRITMIHLDSLVWQIEPLESRDLKSYFGQLGVPRVGSSLIGFLEAE